MVHAEASFRLAQELVDLDPVRAQQLAHDAVHSFGEAKSPPPELDELNQWLAETPFAPVTLAASSPR
jgi:hypothetical protein